MKFYLSMFIGYALISAMPAAAASSGGTDLAPSDEAKASKVSETSKDSEASATSKRDAVDARMRVLVAQRNLKKFADSQSDALVCRKEKRQGSRIKRNRCLSSADWQQEYETRMLKSHLIKTAGKAPAWRTP